MNDREYEVRLQECLDADRKREEEALKNPPSATMLRAEMTGRRAALNNYLSQTRGENLNAMTRNRWTGEYE